MANHVDFDVANRIMYVAGDPVGAQLSLSFQSNFYSHGKDHWRTDNLLWKFRFPMEAIGGQTVAGKQLGVTFLVKYGWKIRPYEADHEFRLAGNVFTDDGSPLFVNTLGGYQVTIAQEVSTLVEVVAESGLTPTETAQLNAIYDGTFGQKVLRDSVDPQGGLPGYLLLYDDSPTPVLLGHKELWADEAKTVGWVELSATRVEGPLVAGSPP